MYVNSNASLKRVSVRVYFEKYIIPMYILVFITLILIMPSVYNSIITEWDTWFILSNLLIGIVAFFMVLYESGRQSYSLHLMHWIFQYVFFFIAPLVQYLNNAFQWGLLNSSQVEEIRYSNFIILIWQACWIIAKMRTDKKQKPIVEERKYYFSNRKINLLLVLSCSVLLYFINVYGINGIFTRGSIDFEKMSSNSSIALLLLYVVRTMPLVLFAVLMYVRRQEGAGRFNGRIVISLILLVLTNFPTATPRFWAAAVYLGVFIIMTRLKSKSMLILMLIIGLNVVFPLLGEARRHMTLSGIIKSISSDRMLSKNILIGDYDAFSMLTYTHIYTADWSITMGKQLFTALFFFVPRTLWSGKSVGSGSMIADQLGLIFNNVSCPLLAEGLINFGIPGVIIFAFFFSSVLTKIDTIYWSKSNIMVTLTYPFWLALFFFMMRGDLLSTLSFIAGLTFVFFFFTRGSGRKNDKVTSN